MVRAAGDATPPTCLGNLGSGDPARPDPFGGRTRMNLTGAGRGRAAGPTGPAEDGPDADTQGPARGWVTRRTASGATPPRSVAAPAGPTPSGREAGRRRAPAAGRGGPGLPAAPPPSGGQRPGGHASPWPPWWSASCCWSSRAPAGRRRTATSGATTATALTTHRAPGCRRRPGRPAGDGLAGVDHGQAARWHVCGGGRGRSGGLVATTADARAPGPRSITAVTADGRRAAGDGGGGRPRVRRGAPGAGARRPAGRPLRRRRRRARPGRRAIADGHGSGGHRAPAPLRTRCGPPVEIGRGRTVEAGPAARMAGIDATAPGPPGDGRRLAARRRRRRPGHPRRPPAATGHPGTR